MDILMQVPAFSLSTVLLPLMGTEKYKIKRRIRKAVSVIVTRGMAVAASRTRPKLVCRRGGRRGGQKDCA
jgi:hypothetical protein